MTRLMDGEVRMAVSIGGFAVGILTFLALVDIKWLTRPAPTPALIGSVLTFALLLSALLLAWAIYELPRIWRNRPKHMGLKDLVLAPQYRLSTAALLIGIASAVIFLLIGSPGYTITLQDSRARTRRQRRASQRGARSPAAGGARRDAGVDLAARKFPPRLAAAIVLAAQYFRRRFDGAWHRHAAGRQRRAHPVWQFRVFRRTRCRPTSRSFSAPPSACWR